MAQEGKKKKNKRKTIKINQIKICYKYKNQHTPTHMYVYINIYNTNSWQNFKQKSAKIIVNTHRSGYKYLL